MALIHDYSPKFIKISCFVFSEIPEEKQPLEAPKPSIVTQKSHEIEQPSQTPEKTVQSIPKPKVEAKLEPSPVKPVQQFNTQSSPEPKIEAELEPSRVKPEQQYNIQSSPKVEAKLESSPVKPEHQYNCRICQSKQKDENALYLHLIMVHFKVSSSIFHLSESLEKKLD